MDDPKIPKNKESRSGNYRDRNEEEYISEDEVSSVGSVEENENEKGSNKSTSESESPYERLKDDGGKKNDNKSIIKESSFSKEDKSVKKTKELLSDLDETDKDKSKSSLGYFLITVAVLGVLIYVSLVLGLRDPLIKEHNYRKPDDFVSEFRAVKKLFPNQDNLYWNMIKNGGRRHLMKVHNSVDKEKSTPQSYLIAGYSGSRSTVKCFVLKIVEALTKKNKPNDQNLRVLDAKHFSNDKDPGNLLKELKSRLNKTEVLIIKNIDSLPYKVANLFMSYADDYNEVASYPQSLLLLTAELPFTFDPERSRHDDERIAAQHFKEKVWGDVPRYKAEPLWSRVGDGLVLIKKEEKNPCIVKEDL